MNEETQMSDWPMLSLSERDRRWQRTGELLRKHDLSCLVVPGSRSREAWDSYLSNEASAGCGVTVFPLESPPVFVMVGASRLFCRVDIMERDLEHWIEDFRVGTFSRVVPEVLIERGLQRGRVGIIGLESIGPAGEEEAVLSYQLFTRLCAALPDVEFVDVSREFALAMLPKSEEEMTLIRHCVEVGEKACAAAVDVAGVGVPEQELFAAAMAEIHRGGAFAIPPMFLLRSGPNNAGHAPPHWIAPRRPPRMLEPGDLVLAEIFTVYGNIETQQQLTLVVGEPSASQKHITDVARRSYEAGLAALRPGVKFSEVFAIMQQPVLQGGCWHINPLIHTIAPIAAWGGMLDGLESQTGIDPGLRNLPRTPVMGDFDITPGMVFAVEPSVAKDLERVTVELSAYKKAKAENDERFMNERDLATAELMRVTQERDEARKACRLAINAFENNDAIDWDIVERNAEPKQSAH